MILSYNPEEIARQITLVDQELFFQLLPAEFLSLHWLDSDREYLAPNIWYTLPLPPYLKFFQSYHIFL